MINESFICENCNKAINKHKTGSARNHCPYCLYSKHLDENKPGDRLSTCKGLMEPIGIDYKKNKGYCIKYRCEKCFKENLNKTADDDNFLDFIKKINENF